MIRNIAKFYRIIMSITPQALLSHTSKEKCITKICELPLLVNDEENKSTAAVLVPLCVVDDEVCLLYTLRSTNLSSHKGQVSFPGGKIDLGESVFETALRETKEEIGLSSEEIDIWTKMSMIPGRDANVLITPVVGVIKNFDMKKLKRNENEVAEIFTVPMKVFCDIDNHACFLYNKITIPVFICGKHKIWGITGIITHLFLQNFLPQDVYEGNFDQKEYSLEDLMPSKL